MVFPVLALNEAGTDNLHFTKMSGTMTTSLKIVCDADNKGEMEFLEVLCTEVVTALVKLGIHYNVWVTPTMTEINREDFLGVLKPHHTLWRRL